MSIYQYSESTLMRMTKQELIDYIRMCEHNCDIACKALEQQARNITELTKNYKPVKISYWRRDEHGDCACNNCNYETDYDTDYCPECGCKMTNSWGR